MRNSGGKLDASSSVILNKTSQGGPINFLAQATQDAGELQESFNEAIYHDLTNVFQEKQKKKKKKRSSPASPVGCNNRRR